MSYQPGDDRPEPLADDQHHIDSEEALADSQPAYLAALAELNRWKAAQPEVETAA